MKTCSSKGSSEGEALAHEAVSTCEHARWTIDNETFFINFLSLKAIDTTTSNNMFKDSVFKEAVGALEDHHPLERGGKKTMASCKSKWLRVCISFIYILPVSCIRKTEISLMSYCVLIALKPKFSLILT